MTDTESRRHPIPTGNPLSEVVSLARWLRDTGTPADICTRIEDAAIELSETLLASIDKLESDNERLNERNYKLENLRDIVRSAVDDLLDDDDLDDDEEARPIDLWADFTPTTERITAPCSDCDIDTLDIDGRSEYFIVRDDVWAAAWGAVEHFGRFLCVECLERRLGRPLHAGDFPPSAPINGERERDTPRLAAAKRRTPEAP